MNRRSLLKYLLAAPVAYQLDIEKLLWIPGEKTIFLPPVKKLTESQIVAIELQRILPYIKKCFERDDMFYKLMNKYKDD